MNAITHVNNYQDIINSRDVIERLDELSALAAPLLREGEKEELQELTELNEQGENYAPDWKYGECLIRDTYFQEYAQELAEEIGAVNPDATWPNNCIDWEQAARDLLHDYSSIDYAGIVYWVRS